MTAAGTSGAAAPASYRRERGIAAYATIFGVTEQELPGVRGAGRTGVCEEAWANPP